MKADALVTVAEGNFAKVVMIPRIAKDFEKIDAAPRAAILKHMESYASHGHEGLNDKQMGPEGRHPVGDKKGTQVLVEAFKAWQVRVYGVSLKSQGVFICSELDGAKKQNKADKGCLERAAKNVAPYL